MLLDCVHVDAPDAEGKTALRCAVDKGQKACVLQLITRGANISAADPSGQTPMQSAQQQGQEELADAMLSYKLSQDEALLACIHVE